MPTRPALVVVPPDAAARVEAAEDAPTPTAPEPVPAAVAGPPVDPATGEEVAEPVPVSAADAPREPREEEHEGRYLFRWPSRFVEFEASRLAEDKDGVRCEITISYTGPETDGDPAVLHHSRLNLLSESSKTIIINKLDRIQKETLYKVDGWRGMLETVCVRALRRYRAGRKAIALREVDYTKHPKTLLAPMLSAEGATVMCGDGSAGKSTWAILLSVMLATGRTYGLMDGTVGPTNVLIADWESSEYTWSERLFAVCKALGLDDVPTNIFYRPMAGSMAEQKEDMRTYADQLETGYIIVDSMVAACGGEMDSRSVVPLFNAMREIGRPWLGITHITKEQAEAQQAGGGFVRPIGSGFFYNYARMVWYLERMQQEGEQKGHVLLSNHKNNNGPLAAKRFYEVEYLMDGDLLDQAVFGLSNAAQHEQAFFRYPLTERITMCLGITGGQLHQDALQARVGTPTEMGRKNWPEVFKNWLHQCVRSGRVSVGDDGMVRLLDRRRMADVLDL